MANLEIVEKRAGPVTLLKLGGHLVADEGDRAFKDRVAALVASGRSKIVVDLRSITYIDSGGVGALVAMHLHTVRRGGLLKLLSPSARVRRVLRITRLTSVFEVFEREEDAVQSFRTPQIALGGSAGALYH